MTRTPTAIVAQLEYVLRVHPDDSATLTITNYMPGRAAKSGQVHFGPAEWHTFANSLAETARAETSTKLAQMIQAEETSEEPVTEEFAALKAIGEALEMLDPKNAPGPPPNDPGMHVVTGIVKGQTQAGVKIEVPNGCPTCAAHTRVTMLFPAAEWAQFIEQAQAVARMALDANDVTRN